MTRENGRHVIRLASRVWILLVFAGVFYYLAANFSNVTDQIAAIALPRLILAYALVIIGKLLLVELSRQSTQVAGFHITYRRMFIINSLSQLAKYLPGGVWHFVGRAGYYHAGGMSLKQATQAIIVENIWLITSACYVGAIFFVLYTATATNLLLVAVLIVLWVVMLTVMTRWRVPQVNSRDVLTALGLQAAIWTSLGAAMWALLSTETADGLLPLGIGAFCLSWAVGYMTLFAPGGLGIREAVLTTLLAAAIDPSLALVYAALNRLVWITTELVLGLIARFQTEPA